MKDSEINFAINDIASYIVRRFAKEKNISWDKALEQVIRTTVYAALIDKDTELYSEPKDAVYDMFEHEMNKEPDELAKTMIYA